MRLRIQQPQTNEAFVDLDGSLDRDTVPEIRRKLLKVACKKTLESITFNLSGVLDIDTAGIALLVEILKWVHRRHGHLRLMGLNEKGKQLIRLTDLDEAFGIECNN